MAVTPPSPDKALVTSPSKEVDNTGWLVTLLKEQKELLTVVINANNDSIQKTVQDQKELLLAIINANDIRYDQRFEASKEAITAALAAAKEAITAALLAADRAVMKAETASEKRFESVNEFRSTLADQQRNLMPRAEAEAVFKNLAEKIDEANKRISDISQLQVAGVSKKEGISDGWKLAVGGVGLIATVISITAVIITLTRN